MAPEVGVVRHRVSAILLLRARPIEPEQPIRF
jgi:hypothetical protein